jgi:hypothetical protein
MIKAKANIVVPTNNIQTINDLFFSQLQPEAIHSSDKATELPQNEENIPRV